MNFGKFIDNLPISIITIMLLSIPFFVYNFSQKDNECKQMGGLLVKTSGGWMCIKAETK